MLISSIYTTELSRYPKINIIKLSVAHRIQFGFLDSCLKYIVVLVLALSEKPSWKWTLPRAHIVNEIALEISTSLWRFRETFNIDIHRSNIFDFDLNIDI
jgi:hypothetical protein